MSDPRRDDPAEVEPTDNSGGAEVDLDRLAEVEREVTEGS